MFSRFFRKSAPKDQRDHYRRAPGRKAALGVKLVTRSGDAVAGELLDVSAGGAAIRFDFDLADKLDLDAEQELRFTSLTKGVIHVNASVRSRPREAKDFRYGFQFLDPGALFAQLDDSFFKYFNRRRWLRVQPALDGRISAEVAVGETVAELQVHDLAKLGVGVVVLQELEPLFTANQSVEIAMGVPRSDARVRCSAIVRHKTATPQGIRMGCSLEVRNEGDRKRSKKAVAAFDEYLAKRAEEMERYNAAF